MELAVAALGDMCLAAVQSYDLATEDAEGLHATELQFQYIVNSPSLDVACKKIDELAAKNQLESELVLKISKTWAAAKETDMSKDEVRSLCWNIGFLYSFLTRLSV